MKAGMRRARASWCECSAAKKGKRTLVVARGSQHPTEETNTDEFLISGWARHAARLLLEVDRGAEPPVERLLERLLPLENGGLLRGDRIHLRLEPLLPLLAELGGVILAAVDERIAKLQPGRRRRGGEGGEAGKGEEGGRGRAGRLQEEEEDAKGGQGGGRRT